MQAITIAIGKTGIRFFAQHYLLDKLQQLLGSLKPPDRTISIPDFMNEKDMHQIFNMVVYLSGNKLVGYSSDFQDVVQGLNDQQPVFTLTLGSSGFSANFNWHELYTAKWTEDYGKGPIYFKKDRDHTYDYNPSFTQLLVTVPLVFLFDKNSNAWEIKVQGTSGQSQGAQANIPPGSPLNGEEQSGCSRPHIGAATAQMIGAIDFAKAIEPVIQGVIASIPGSGNLGDNIVYDFSLSAPDQLVFPNNNGIQIGVKGGASYKDTDFPGTPPPPLPLPTPPADSDEHHLNMYVSNYEVDALYWAYFQAGKLQRTVTPQDLPNPEALDVSTYVGWESALQIYADKRDVMNAVITPNSAPVTSFQTVYIYGTSAMSLLQKQLPANIYAQIQNLASAPFLSKQDLENFLKNNQVPNQYFTTIESAGLTPGMVVSHDLKFNLVIQDTQYNYPYINFKVNRTDILTDLCLGLTDKAQTLQFGFYNAVNSATFIDSSVPNFNGAFDFGGPLWKATGETSYADCLKKLGKTGTPLPIMEGMQFDFTNAVLSIQEHYVSILANVLYQNS